MYLIIMDVIIWPMVLIMILAWIGAIIIVAALVFGAVLIIRHIMRRTDTPDVE